LPQGGNRFPPRGQCPIFGYGSTAILTNLKQKPKQKYYCCKVFVIPSCKLTNLTKTLHYGFYYFMLCSVLTKTTFLLKLAVKIVPILKATFISFFFFCFGIYFCFRYCLVFFFVLVLGLYIRKGQALQ